MGPRDRADKPFLTMRAEVKNSNTTGIFADLLLDLRAIYKLTLLSFEISTEKSKSDIQTFVFPESQREIFYKENKKGLFIKILKDLFIIVLKNFPENLLITSKKVWHLKKS